VSDEILDLRFAIGAPAAVIREPAMIAVSFADLAAARLNYLTERQTAVGNRQPASPIANRKSKIANP
jgi:hypothetical protein